MKKTLFIKNALILTVSSFALRFAGIIFKVWLAALIGSEGIGLYQLIFSVYVLISTFATSGISTAVTRLVAEESALGSQKSVIRILKRSIELSLVISLISILLTFFGAEPIAKYFIGDTRAAAALKILPFSLPFMAVSSCLRGYFIARRRVTPNAVTQLLEQGVRIALVAFLVKMFIKKGLAVACAAVMVGDVASEIVGFSVLFLLYSKDKRKLSSLSGRANPPYSVLRKLTHISLPITLGRYLNSLLRTVENVMVPKSLAKYPKTNGAALSQFGMIKGMALPVLFFPSAILNSISTLLIPEISEAAATNQKEMLKSSSEKVLKLTGLISFIFSAIFFAAGEEIGFLVYKDYSVGFLIKALAPIVPFMYLDSISDGILKGLDQQAFTFRTAITDSVLRIVLVLIVLSKTGLAGFIGIMYFSNFLTCFLNVKRLLLVSGAKVRFLKEIATPIMLSFVITFITDTALKVVGITNGVVYIMLATSVSICCYVCCLFLFEIVTLNELPFNLKVKRVTPKNKNLPR